MAEARIKMREVGRREFALILSLNVSK